MSAKLQNPLWVVLTSLLSGVLFAAGLILSEMVNPAKVLGFLDIFGNWDPSLAFVMGAALIVYSSGYFLIAKKRGKPFFANAFALPTKQDLDNRLVIGAATFGTGWGIVGLCPGPVLANIALLELNIIVFIIFMLIGIHVAKRAGKTTQ
ncbi:MAG: YeeE/YedE family protein [Alteromonadaceae bacterium]|nr:YeeE/YedE family protein [Alteromonadaceae bacterium]